MRFHIVLINAILARYMQREIRYHFDGKWTPGRVVLGPIDQPTCFYSVDAVITNKTNG